LIAKLYGSYAGDEPEAYAGLEKYLAKPMEPNASAEAKLVLANPS
jgi:hypothetical protein